jgi:hypothetical protein
MIEKLIYAKGALFPDFQTDLLPHPG